MRLDGDHYPTRVRAAWVSDEDIAATAARCPARREGEGQAVTVDGSAPPVALMTDSA
jgi:hypothetical protein